MTNMLSNIGQSGWLDRRSSLFSDIDSAFSTLLGSRLNNVQFQAGKDDFKYSIDLPGVRKEDLKLTVESGYLIVEAKRRVWVVENESDANAYATIRQALELPEEADPEKVEASLVDGVLYIKAHKRDEAKPRSIQISVN